jgi:Family of unknown function (DUF5677)
MKPEEIMMKTILQHVEEKATEEQLDEEQIKKLIDAAVKAVTTEGLKNASAFLADTLRKQIPEMVAYFRTMQEEFEQRLYDQWKKALDLYDAIIMLTMECGESFVNQHEAQSAKDKDNVFSAIKSIHLKACQTSLAIGALLKSGYARDALARQRTLHELACIALFIQRHGQETAGRYWLHNTIESYKAALQYEQNYKRLGYAPQDTAKLDQLRSERDALVTRFGTGFKEQYGWAAKALDKERVTFADIEKDVQLDHLRPYYQMASYGVHANSKGLIVDVGHPYLDIPGYQKMIFAGASNAGLAEPGQSALISLYQCTVAYLTYKNDLNTLMKLQVLNSFLGEACQAFIEIHRDLEREEEERIKTRQTQD